MRSRDESMPSYSEFTSAMSVFSGDLSLVQAHSKPISPFESPQESHEPSRQYVLTQWPTRRKDGLPFLGEKRFRDQMASRKVLAIACEDFRLHPQLYRDLLLDSQYRPEDIALLSLAGGIIQPDYYGGQRRADALRTSVRYMTGVGENLELIFASGHDRRCKLVAYSLYIEKEAIAEELPHLLHAHDEAEATAKLIINGVRTIIPEDCQEYTKPVLVTPSERGETKRVDYRVLSLHGPSASLEDALQVLAKR